MTPQPNPVSPEARQVLAEGMIWLIAFSLMLQPLSTDFYVASLPFIGEAFQASPAQVQNTLSFFAIGFGLAQLIAGPLSDRFGRRPALMTGLALYALASLVCLLAPSLDILVAGRVGQAVGCCTSVLVARAIIRDSFTLAQGAAVMAKASTLMSLAPLLGPVLGGFLQAWFGWRAVFAPLFLISATLCVVVARRLPETIPALNYDAIALRGLTATYRRILGSGAFWAYALPGALSYASIFVFISGTSMVLVKGMHMAPQEFGFYFALGVSGYLSGTLACQRLIRKKGVPFTLRLGTWAALLAGGAFWLLVNGGVHHWGVVILAQWMVMGAHGLTFPCAQTGAAAEFPKNAGAAAGLSGFMSMVCALAAGMATGQAYDGTPLPMSHIALVLALLLWASGRCYGLFHGPAGAPKV
ncbi:MAG: multidrug effflux MFS transporter [Zoogloea sp.]|uniref:multidrug effflux MFS transporter n=1 Tax=Zoogloea sp. TaxID=49181 RepID=UPI003F2E2E61